jgi:hypothetical protein
MIKPVRLQVRRVKGANIHAESKALNGLPVKCVTRVHRSPFANPFPKEPKEKLTREVRARLVEKFTDWLHNTPEGAKMIEDAKAQLRNHNLACWCALDGGPCHAQVLIDITNNEE